MRLIWHIIAKDVRRVAWVWLAWLALLVTAVTWMQGRGSVGGAAVGMVAWLLIIALGFVVAGILMLEDPISDGRAAWRTRPVGRVRLLATKLACGLLLMGVTPWLLTGPARSVTAGWFTVGTWSEALFLPLVVPALAIGALARDVGHFALCSVFLAVVHVAMKALAGIGPLLPAHERVAREVWLQAPVWPLMSAVLIVQVLTGRTRLGWALIGAWGVAVVLRGIWPWLAAN